MEITKEEVARVAQLSRLIWSEGALDEMRGELSSILEYMRTLEQLETEGAEASVGESAPIHVVRDDTVCPSYDRGALLANAAVRNEESIIVPKTVE